MQLGSRLQHRLCFAEFSRAWRPVAKSSLATDMCEPQASDIQYMDRYNGSGHMVLDMAGFGDESTRKARWQGMVEQRLQEKNCQASIVQSSSCRSSRRLEVPRRSICFSKAQHKVRIVLDLQVHPCPGAVIVVALFLQSACPHNYEGKQLLGDLPHVLISMRARGALLIFPQTALGARCGSPCIVAK